VRPEFLQKFNHLLIAAARPPGEVIDDDVLEVEVAHRNSVGVTVAPCQGLGDCPRPNPEEPLQSAPGNLRRIRCEQVDGLGVGRHPTQDVGAFLLEVELVIIPIRCRRHLLGIGGKAELRSGSRSRVGELLG
jgi:hypothetical protein